MGIGDFYKVINEWCPNVLVTVKLSDLAGVSVAVDISIFLNKFVKTAGASRWIENFMILLCTLKKHGIKPVCIFDGPNPPIEKRREQERRRAEAAKKKERINQGKVVLKTLEREYVPNNKKLSPEFIEEIKLLIGVHREKKQKVNYDDVTDVVACLTDALEKMEIQNLPILPIYAQMAKRIIEIMGFAHFQADGEAEALCSGMCHVGLVDAVLSEDTDVLAIGAPYLLSKLDLLKGTVVAISYMDILDTLGFTSAEFRDLCILLGCDYNDRVKGYPPDGKNRKKPVGIGAKGAYHMINEYRSLEAAEPYMVDPDPLIYQRCRELFTPPEDLPDITIPYNKPIDQPGLVAFMKEYNVRMNIGYILASWKPATLKFEYTDVLEEDAEDSKDVDDEQELTEIEDDFEEEIVDETELIEEEIEDAEEEIEDAEK